MTSLDINLIAFLNDSYVTTASMKRLLLAKIKESD